MGTGRSQEGDRTRFEVTMPAQPAALPQARHAFSRWMAAHGVDDEDRADLEVVFSELATNAMSASPDAGAVIDARAGWADREITLEITNASVASSSIRRWDLRDQLRQGGRGLLIVRAFVDAIEIGRSGSGAMVVRCRRRVRVGTPGRPG